MHTAEATKIHQKSLWRLEETASLDRAEVFLEVSVRLDTKHLDYLPLCAVCVFGIMNRKFISRKARLCLVVK